MKIMKKENASGGTRTHNLSLRTGLLYPIELQTQYYFDGTRFIEYNVFISSIDSV